MDRWSAGRTANDRSNGRPAGLKSRPGTDRTGPAGRQYRFHLCHAATLYVCKYGRRMKGNQYFSAPNCTYVYMYDGRNNVRFIPKGIWIYWKIPMIPIKISPGICWIGWKWSRRKRKDCGNRWWLKMNYVN